MKALALVAHPDDCLIFGHHFITSNPKFKWKIIYLTHTVDHPRFAEMLYYWNNKGIPASTLGFIDDWYAVNKGKLGFKKSDAVAAIKKATNQRYFRGITLIHNGEKFLQEQNHI